jgi:hypothetical protein
MAYQMCLSICFQVTYPVSNLPMNGYTSDDLPKAVARTLNQGSNVISMDFHPAEQTLLLGEWI